MKIILFTLSLSIVPMAVLQSQSVAELRKTSCADCHNQEFSGFKKDLHFTEGKLICTDCHGGDAVSGDEDTSMYLSPDWVGRPAPNQVAVYCGRCHESVLKNYANSRNAEKYGMGNLTIPRPRPVSREISLDPDHPSPDTWKACISCHSVHGMKEPVPAIITETADRFPEVRLERGVATVLQDCADDLDSLKQAAQAIRERGLPLDPSVWRDLDSLQAAFSDLKIVQHSMKTTGITSISARFSVYRETVEEQIIAAEDAQADRTLGLLFMWGFILAASAFLFAKQRRVGPKQTNGEPRS